MVHKQKCLKKANDAKLTNFIQNNVVKHVEVNTKCKLNSNDCIWFAYLVWTYQIPSPPQKKKIQKYKNTKLKVTQCV